MLCAVLRASGFCEKRSFKRIYGASSEWIPFHSYANISNGLGTAERCRWFVIGDSAAALWVTT
ncbi:hypothetical protein POX_c04009 [Penicillium oxalicum]|uniref:hypothetical protein n=1 Tax=Penicillium oxalicum TaxID=69781 RepID=UPI0020B7F522|nr:hypothetical protein POX_c04009 [Penicillium oxalicum]KAI2791153.1 hypothetical protein POX_c04009 [Penicillium oxalicum]